MVNENKQVLTVNREDRVDTRDDSREDRTRIPLAQQNLQETIDKDPKFEYYLLNENPADLQRHEQAGWTVVKSKSLDENSTNQEDGINRVLVNRRPDAPVKHGIWIKKPKEWYEEDAAAERREKSELDARFDPNHPLNHTGADYGEMKVTYKSERKLR